VPNESTTRTKYPVIEEPPLLVGAVHLTVADVLPAVTDPSVGAPGTVVAEGLTELEAPDGFEVPAALVAVTVKVY